MLWRAIAKIIRFALFLAGFAITGVLVLLFVGAFLSRVPDDQFAQGDMPICTSKVVSNLLMNAVNESPQAKTFGVKALDVGDLATLSDSTATKRHCAATVFTNSGKRKMTFTVEWTDSARTKIWLQTEN